MKQLSAIILALAMMVAGYANASYVTKIYKEPGGDKEIVVSGGEIEVQSGATLDVQSGATVNLQGLSFSATEMGYLDGTTPGTQVASKVVVPDSNVNIGAAKVTALHIGTSGSETQVTATGAELNYNDITTLGTGAASKAVVLDTGDDYTWPATGILTYGVLKDPAGTTLGATVAELNGAADLSTQVMTAGAGFAGTGTIYKVSAVKHGSVIVTTYLLDLTGTSSSTTDLDIIGTSGVSYIGQITAALSGTVLGGTMTCLEVPTGGIPDIDLYFATEGTGAFDGAVGDLTETALVTAGGNWTLGLSKPFIADPAANSYLYLTGGAAGTAAAYTAGRFLIEIYGY